MKKKSLQKRVKKYFKKLSKKKNIDTGLVVQIIIVIAILIFLATIFIGTNTQNFNYNYNSENITSAGKSFGEENAPVTITMWSDAQCGFCGRFTSETLPKIEAKYISTGKVKIEYKHFPGHKDSQVASEAAECAAEQGQFWEYHKRLYFIGDFSKTNLAKIAGEFKMDSEKFLECLDSGKYSEIPKIEMQQGIEAGLRGTPHFLINGESLIGAQPFNEFERIIDQELAKIN